MCVRARARGRGLAGSPESGGGCPGSRRRPGVEVGVEESDLGGGEAWSGVGLAGAMPGEKPRWKSAHLRCVGAPGGRTAGGWSLFFILGLEVPRNNIICS